MIMTNQIFILVHDGPRPYPTTRIYPLSALQYISYSRHHVHAAIGDRIWLLADCKSTSSPPLLTSLLIQKLGAAMTNEHQDHCIFSLNEAAHNIQALLEADDDDDDGGGNNNTPTPTTPPPPPHEEIIP